MFYQKRAEYNGKPIDPARYANRGSWPYYTLNAIEHLLDASFLDRAEFNLNSSEVGRIQALNNDEHSARLKAAEQALAAARITEALNGPGSLIVRNHPVLSV